MTPHLWTFDKAARETNVPVASLRRAADRHRLTIKIGRAVRIDPNDLGKLFELCRAEAKGRDYSGEEIATSGTSETAKSDGRPARQAAQMLKSCSPHTSSESTGQLVRLDRMK